MGDNAKNVPDIVHLARIALSGRSQDIQLYIQRLARKYRDNIPGLAEQLAGLLRESPTRQSPLRRGAEPAVPVPVDADSRLHLVRLDHAPAVDVEPIWTAEVEASLRRLVRERQLQADLARANLSPTRTAVFTGLPGVGKSLAARWLASLLDWPLVILDLSAVMSSFLGRTGANLRHVLDYAKSIDCVFLLDEFDAIAKRRDDIHEIGELKRLVTVLLQEIDDWPPGGLLVAATNHPGLLDPAAWRRFEMVVDFPMPEDAAVRQAVSAFLGPDNHLADGWLDVLAAMLRGLSFSDIEREITGLRRDAIVHEKPLEASCQDLVGRRIDAIPRSKRGELGASLIEIGLSQRQIHEMTGISRDTIRKAIGGRPVRSRS